MFKIDAQFKSSSHNVYIKEDKQDTFYEYLKKLEYNKIFILTNKLIYHLHSNHEIFNQGYDILNFNENETIKSIEQAEKIINELISKGCNRNSLIIGVGGGNITDLTGFIASIFMRGINHIFVPTTLLGMVDASIGGKTGINVSSGKNLIGTFKQPKDIFIDSLFLDTLGEQQIKDGFAEIIKYGLICDFALYENIKTNFNNLISLQNKDLINNIILKCVKHKINIVTKDEFDQNQRMLLNFGHTIGHALESYYDYKHITHGDAVYYGMLSAIFISFKLDYLNKNDFEDIVDFIKQIPHFTIKNIDIDKLFNCLKYDKKNIDNMQHFIIIDKIGNAIIKKNISKELIFESINFIIK